MIPKAIAFTTCYLYVSFQGGARDAKTSANLISSSAERSSSALSRVHRLASGSIKASSGTA